VRSSPWVKWTPSSEGRDGARREAHLDLIEVHWECHRPEHEADRVRDLPNGRRARSTRGCSLEHLVRSEFAIEIGTASDLPESWKRVAPAKGFTELPEKPAFTPEIEAPDAE